jgi:hypothetical protein
MMWKSSLRSRGAITAATIFAFVSGQLMAQQTNTGSTKPVFVTSGQELYPQLYINVIVLYNHGKGLHRFCCRWGQRLTGS